MSKQSAGILAYRRQGGVLQVLLVHPGGPYHSNRDIGDWSIPKGEFDEEEDALVAAKREFAEEIGMAIEGTFQSLSPIRQKSGKRIFAFGVETALAIDEVRSNTFTIEWPPRSGKMQTFPEVDKAEWFGIDEAKQKIIPAQAALIDELMAIVS